MTTKRIKDLSTSITAFRTGDVIPVDGPSGTAKMAKDDLLRVTAQNAVDSGVAASKDEIDGKYSVDDVVFDGNTSLNETITINYSISIGDEFEFYLGTAAGERLLSIVFFDNGTGARSYVVYQENVSATSHYYRFKADKPFDGIKVYSGNKSSSLVVNKLNYTKGVVANFYEKVDDVKNVVVGDGSESWVGEVSVVEYGYASLIVNIGIDDKVVMKWNKMQTTALVTVFCNDANGNRVLNVLKNYSLSSDGGKFEFVAKNEAARIVVYGAWKSPQLSFYIQRKDRQSLEYKMGELNSNVAPFSCDWDVRAIGRLHKDGCYIVDATDTKVELRGVGLHSLPDYPNLHNFQTFNALKHMGVNTIRISVYLDDYTFINSEGIVSHGYLNHENELKKYIDDVVRTCVDVGMYFIIDWHCLNENIVTSKSRALDFFDYMSNKYGSLDNVMFELLNEPYHNSVSEIVDFVTDARQVILSNCTNPVMISGIPGSYDDGGVEKTDRYGRTVALYNALVAEDIADVFLSPHMYEGDDTNTYDRLIADGIPFVVSEWGNCGFDGDGDYYDLGALTQIDYLHEKCIMQCLWKLGDNTSKCATLKNYGYLNAGRYKRGVFYEDLSHNGKLLFGRFEKFAKSERIER